MGNSILNIGSEFLKSIDDHLREKWRVLTCDDIFNFYKGFWNELKRFRGNSHGFTGLSEYLIFRFLFHQLGGQFERQEITDNLSEFISKSDGKLKIAQSKNIRLNEKRCCPDIVIEYDNKLMAVIQIKICLTRGCKELEEEINKLEEIKRKYSKIKALLIIFWKLSRLKKEGIFSKLKEIEKRNEWFKFLILEGDNKDLLWKKLEDYLDLGGIR